MGSIPIGHPKQYMKMNEAEKTSASLIQTVQRDVLKIDTEKPVSPDALLMAIAYEGDLVWMRRNNSIEGGDMGLPAPTGTSITELDTVNTDRLTKSRKNIEQAIRIRADVSNFEAAASDSVLQQFGLSLTADELRILISGFELGEKVEPISVLLALAPTREARLELERAYALLQQSDESMERVKMAVNIQREIEKAGITTENIDYVIGIPVIGYGNQTLVFEQTIKCLDQMEIPDGALVVFNVNLPSEKLPDNTFSLIQEYVFNKRAQGLNFIAVQSSIEGGVMMGDVRSAIFDGFLAARKDPYECKDVVFLSTDDDNILMPNDWITACREDVARRGSLAVYPTTFGGLGRSANENFPNFMLSENLRCVVAEYILGLISEIDSKQVKSLQEMQWLIEVVFGGKVAGYIESVVLSTVAVSAQKYQQIGGYPAQDEITKYTRLVVLDNLLKGGFTGIVPISNTRPVLTDNRRQLAAYFAERVSPVAAWKNPATRFQSDEVDPVRTNRTLAIDTATIDFEGLSELDLMFSQTFFYMGIKDPDLARIFLEKLGINTQKVSIEMYKDGSLGFSFKVGSLQELYD